MQKPVMTPAPGERLLRFVGDLVRFDLRCDDAASSSCALLRTNLGKAEATRREIISSYAGQRPLSVSFWRDIPMQKISDGNWSIELPATEIGFFRAKAYLVNSEKKQIWPDGENVGVSIHPNCYRTANTIYCAFTRTFGASKFAKTTRDEVLENKMRELDELGFTVIPPSGKLRDVIKELPHIIDKLGCKILHLLPVNPTPTTLARMGRFGSPYACQDLTAIDPALVEFDQRTNAADQFSELTFATHARGAKVFLDVVINHTGWGSTLFENHPEWFLREHDGTFASPGAWGNIWADLVELNPNFTGLWEHLADAFLTWCRRGVDGFRCDAGYKVPLPVWQYIEARVRQEFPETLFLLEGLGGSWDATENLLTEGGMQWAYSELFQNYSGAEVQWYLDYALRQSERVGVYVHYSETHDNDRLAKKGREWSLLRNRLSGLTSICGGFGFTCGVEWLAAEKIEVHQSRGLSWNNEENIIPELAQLNELLATHPAFFDSAKLTRLSENVAPIYALRRDSAEGKDSVLVLVNNDTQNSQTFVFDEKIYNDLGKPKIDLLNQALPKIENRDGKISFTLKPAAAFCLAAKPKPEGLSGENYRREKAQAAWAISAMSKILLPEEIGLYSWRELAKRVDENPGKFLAGISYLKSDAVKTDLLKALDGAVENFPNVVQWKLSDRNRVTPVPPNHWLLLQDSVPFRAILKFQVGTAQHVQSIPVATGHVAFFPPRAFQSGLEAELSLERYANEDRNISATIHFLSIAPQITNPQASDLNSEMVLLTNGIGGMARMCVDLGRVNSKYDCLLGANLHPTLPTDRHIFAKRVRVWVNADGFITPLNLQSLDSFEIGPPAKWRFLAKAGNERIVEIHLTADMLDEHNTTVLQFQG
ncbi:MAG: alpha-amylase family glycosyl hydrolase, partial [Verrucomicrobiota bacterium]|nr:alpha-amylase family glycosyl hydrolase [Verrucomicrobiota bacterium]